MDDIPELKKMDILTIIAILIMLGVIALGIYYIKYDGGRCLESPITYGLKEIKESLQAETSCFCSIEKPANDRFFVNTSGMFWDKSMFSLP